MIIILYKNSSEANRVNKESSLEEIMRINGTLRDASSIINPVIAIDTLVESYIVGSENEVIVNDENVPVAQGELMASLLSCNYAYIPDFKRFYFITNITSLRNNLWALSLNVDVLMSFKNDIKAMSAYVSRNEFQYNKEIVDPDMIFQNDADITIYDYNNGLLDDEYDRGLRVVLTSVTKN